MNPEFINEYIEVLNSEVNELSRQKVLQKTQIAWLEKTNANLSKQVQQLQVDLEKALNKAPKSKKENDF
jgi:uncharacterized protein YecT (DUF1311 family)